ncbi:MAG: hypothetical protein MJZ24_07945 [Paludibacteraceae bacterium]|nr:hypothetical protein [Candidatus Physcocola equi]MCQ2234648.1 hypothetical protein [Paludibacteraceae bacterium]
MKLLKSLFCALLLSNAWSANATTDSTGICLLPASDSKRSKAISVKYDQGQMLKTNDFLKEDGRDLNYRAMAVKFAIGVPGNSYQNLDCHKPYTGLGFYMADFNESRYFGHPFSIFLFHGGSLAELSQRCHLQYEWNFGYSTNWGHYDPIDAPNNITIGSSENAHIGFNLFFEWQLTRNFDLKIGGGFTHFSNGATHMPNKGMNLWSPMIELAYRWDDPSYIFDHTRLHSDSLRALYPELRTPEDWEKRIRHDITFTVSKRQLYMDTLGSGLPNKFYDHTFRVFQLSYSPMYKPHHKFAYGPSIDLVYDESNNSYVRKETGADGFAYNRLHLGATGDRFQLGLAARGELQTPYFAYIGQLGYDLIHAASYSSRFYQLMAVKVNLTPHLYGTCGIRAVAFSKAQFIYWSLGYSIDQLLGK